MPKESLKVGKKACASTRRIEFCTSRFHFPRHRQQQQLRHVDEVASVAENHAAGSEHHRTPEHQEQQRFRVVLVREECGGAEHGHGEQENRRELQNVRIIESLVEEM